jgi:hypothetical protein
MNPSSVSLALQRINTPISQALLVLPKPSRTHITYQLLSRHQLLIQHPFPFPLLRHIISTSRMLFDYDNASRCLKCSQLKS